MVITYHHFKFSGMFSWTSLSCLFASTSFIDVPNTMDARKYVECEAYVFLLCFAGQKKRCCQKSYCSNDCWEGCLIIVHWCSELHANRKFGAQKVSVLISDKLCKEPAWPSNTCCEYICKGKNWNKCYFLVHFCLLFIFLSFAIVYFLAFWVFLPICSFSLHHLVIPIFCYHFMKFSQIHKHWCRGCWFTQEMRIWKYSLLLYCTLESNILPLLSLMEVILKLSWCIFLLFHL